MENILVQLWDILIFDFNFMQETKVDVLYVWILYHVPSSIFVF